MKPLTWIGFGFVLLALNAPINGYDAYADWVGWIFFLVGVRRWPKDFPFRAGLTYLGAIAAITAAVLWVPSVLDALDGADESLAWAANLPHFGTAAVYCFALARAADDAEGAEGSRRAAAWWRTLYAACLIVIALPVLVFGGGLDQLADIGGLVVSLVILALPVASFVYSGRGWAGAPPPPEPTESSEPTEPTDSEKGD